MDGNCGYFLTHVPHVEDNEMLRAPQKAAYASVAEHFILKEKQTHALVILPTGVGKTGLMGLLPYGISKGRVLVITPQIVIKEHVSDSLDPDYPSNFWLKHGVFSAMSELPVLVEYDRDTTDEVLNLANIVVVNIQKLQSRLANSLINRVPEDFFDMIIVDEAHHSTANTWIDVLHYFFRSKVVKLTGTPYRSDGKPIVGEITYNYRLSAAMANGYVKSLESFVYLPENLMLTLDDNSEKEYSLEEIYDLGLRDAEWVSRTVAYSKSCSQSVVKRSIELLDDRLEGTELPLKILAVACSIKHAMQIKELYEAEGYPTTIMHSDLTQEEKTRAVSDIENHRVKAIVNVAMLGEGYDHKYLSVGAIFRPFRSQLPYEQFVGRLLRVIPDEENPSVKSNIAAVVSHRELGLDKLWNHYKKEIEAAKTIMTLKDLPLESFTRDDPKEGQGRDTSVGDAEDFGVGKIIVDPYVTTELIKKRKQEEAQELDKIKQLQSLLNISAEEAKKFVKQANSKSVLKRPDIYLKNKRSGIDHRIKEDLVPKLLVEFGISKETTSLSQSRLFKLGKYRWISSRGNNAAMLAIYITNALNDAVGGKRDEWQMGDWDLAEQKLDEIEEYLSKVLEDFSVK